MATRRAYHESGFLLTPQFPSGPDFSRARRKPQGGELTMSAQITGILQIAISVKDIDRATAFYRDVLGLPLLFNAPNMAFFDCGGIRIYLASGEGAEQHGASSHVYFRCTDVAALSAALKEKSVSIHQEPHIIARMPGHDLWLMWIRDSEQNLLGVMEERKR
jgi:predicted enzyme related to lactoylglutathione lyase